LGVDIGPAVATRFAPWGNVKVGYRF
jgi:hypothetical protein